LLLVVVSLLFAVPILVLLVGLEKIKYLNFDVRIFLQGHILSTTGAALRSKMTSEESGKKECFNHQLDSCAY
jgi:hypothetical protein